jgi:hypothetical protein
VDQHLLKVLEVEVRYQCEIGIAGGERLKAAHEEAMAQEKDALDNIWFALQGILGIAANVAKLLWGSKGPETEIERLPLREAASVTDDSPLKPRAVRNAFEHFDERIIDWHKSTDMKIYASRNIGTDPEWPPAEARFGYYEPRSRVVTFLGDSASIPRPARRV